MLLSILQVGLKADTVSARDLFAHSDLGQFTKFFSAKVNPSGVVMVKLTPVKEDLYWLTDVNVKKEIIIE